MLALASALYRPPPLTATAAHTLRCKVTGGVTYVPIPAGAGENFAGLLTVDLPTTVVTGQEFNVVVRRIGTRQRSKRDLRTHSLPSTVDAVSKDGKPGAAKATRAQALQAVAAPRRPSSWRYVVGTFQVKIPVATAQVMLFPEQNTLAIMKWRLQQMAPSSRWHAVLERYIDYVAARVRGLGGDPDSIAPSPYGIPPGDLGRPAEHEYTGKVCEVFFDCFGDFDGFVLDDCHGAHTFRTRQRGIGEIAVRACKEQLLLSVYVESAHEHRICRLAIRS